jgi:hypothetical protein
MDEEVETVSRKRGVNVVYEGVAILNLLPEMAFSAGTFDPERIRLLWSDIIRDR